MLDPTEPPIKPVLKKPPGFKDPNAPTQPPLKPQRKPVIPASIYTQKRRRSCCLTCCYCTSILVLIVALVLAVMWGLFYFWYEPRLPVFHLKSFQIPRFNVTTKPDDGTYLAALTQSWVEVKNPNHKLDLFYGPIQVEISTLFDDDETELGTQTLPGFTQDKRNVTNLKVETRVTNLLVAGGVGKWLKSEFRSKRLPITIEVRTNVGIKTEGLKLGPVDVSIKCNDMQMKTLQGGEIPKCTVSLFNWINI